MRRIGCTTPAGFLGVGYTVSAHIIVTPTPFIAVMDDEGRFQIEDIPSGRYLVRTWHKKRAPIPLEVDVADPSTNLELELTK